GRPAYHGERVALPPTCPYAAGRHALGVQGLDMTAVPGPGSRVDGDHIEFDGTLDHDKPGKERGIRLGMPDYVSGVDLQRLVVSELRVKEPGDRSGLLPG